MAAPPFAAEGGALAAIAVNVGLLGLFGVQHATIARPAFEKRWTRIITAPLERSTFVLATCICLGLLLTFWRAMPTVVWEVVSGFGRGLLWTLSALGWGVVLISTFLIDHFELFGIKQAFFMLLGREVPQKSFRTPLF